MKIRTICLLILVSGCMVGPNYKSPENAINDSWQAEGASDLKPITAWWTEFKDPQLDKIIESAALNNKDIARAEAMILQARAMRDVAASKFFPQLTTDISAIKTYFSKNGPVFATQPGGGPGGGITSPTTGLPFSVQVPQIQNLYTALFDASWEIDFFGKTRRAVEGAKARIDSAIDQRNDTLITVLAEVARNYIELRSFQQQVAYIEQNIHLLEQQCSIVRDQFQVGLTNQLDVENIQAQLASVRATLPDMIAGIYRSIYTLSLLTGNPPETLVDQLLPVQELPKPPDVVAVGLRSDLLRRRPDVRHAERELAAATADVGVAVAAFYPTFTLLGDAGLQSLQVRNLFQSASKTWAYGGDFNVPIYEGGKLVGNYHATEAAQSMALAAYQQTVLTALQDTESALVAYSESLKTAQQRKESTESYRKIKNLSSDRYQSGLIGLIEYLNSQQQLIMAEQSQLESDTLTLVDLIALYKALGGGWEPQEIAHEEKNGTSENVESSEGA